MVLPISNVTSINDVDEIDPEEDELNQEPEDYESSVEQYEEESNVREFSQNQVQLTFSWSLMNQLRYLARTEGIGVEDLLTELVAEGVTKRAFEDQNKPMPSHLMTRNGYVHNTNDGNSTHAQPQMSHHAMNNNRAPNGQVNRNKPGVQARNGQYNSPRYQNQQNRNYQGNNRNNQQRYNQRPGANPNQTSNQSLNQVNQNQRYSNEEGQPLLPKKKY